LSHLVQVRQRNHPAGTWDYWILKTGAPSEGSLDHYHSEEEASKAGHERLQQIVHGAK